MLHEWLTFYATKEMKVAEGVCFIAGFFTGNGGKALAGCKVWKAYQKFDEIKGYIEAPQTLEKMWGCKRGSVVYSQRYMLNAIMAHRKARLGY